MSGFGGLLELIGGALLVLGLFTRPVAFILCGEMAIAYWWAHAPRGFFPVLNGGDAAILYCFIAAATRMQARRSLICRVLRK